MFRHKVKVQIKHEGKNTWPSNKFQFSVLRNGCTCWIYKLYVSQPGVIFYLQNLCKTITFTGFLQYYEQMMKHCNVNIGSSIFHRIYLYRKFYWQKSSVLHNIRVFLTGSCCWRPCQYKISSPKYFYYFSEGIFLYISKWVWDIMPLHRHI